MNLSVNLPAKMPPMLAALAVLGAGTIPAHAQSTVPIYDVNAAGSSDFVPFENDGTPSRPAGDQLGNTITFAGTARFLTHAQVVFSSLGPKEDDTYTLSLYRNDGPLDAATGLLAPGTKIASFQTVASNKPLPGNSGYGVNWFFAPTLVPDTHTAVVSSSYSTTTPEQFMGPFAVVTKPLIGSALNTIWYGDGTPGHWQDNSQWAINDGAATNNFDMHFDASPVPEASTTVSLGLLLALGAFGLAGPAFMRRRKRS